MDFGASERSRRLGEELLTFVEEVVRPAEDTYERQLEELGDPHGEPAVMEELKAAARERGLWNLFHPDPAFGAGLSNTEYAPLAEISGRCHLAPEAINCSAPDTGNMEVLTQFGTPAQQDRWLRPLLDGEIRSGFAMTEPGVASADATNIELRIRRDGDSYVLDGRKWWTSGAMRGNCKVLVVMGMTDPEAPPHRRQSMILVPLDTPGVTVVRNLPVFGFVDQEGHAEIVFEGARVPAANLIAGEGDGFMIAQARLGPGRVHHCMRAVGTAEYALELSCRRALERETFGTPIATRANVMDWIAESRIEIEMVRLLIQKTAWLIDTVGNKVARTEIAAIKVAAPKMALAVLDRAIQIHGGGGMSNDFPLARSFAHARALRIADGPDEVHKLSIARRELRRFAAE